MKETQRTMGNALSWALGVGLGTILGIALLIGASRLAPETLMEGDGVAPAAEATANEAAAKVGGQEASATPAPADEPSAPAAEGTTPTAAGETAAGGAGDAAAGQEAFAGTCGGCHGAGGEGGVGPALNTAATWDLAGFSAALREGKTPDGRELAAMMPRFSPAQLDDAQLANIHAFVQTLK